jgi:putative transposase
MDIFELIEEDKLRRFFHSRYKIEKENGIYHVVQHAPGKEILFVEEADYLYMLYLMKEKTKEFSFRIFYFALLTNHLHLLLLTEKANLSKAMKNLFETYAKHFNKKYQRKGPVFCKPFRAALCLDEGYLLTSSLYIHLNPIKAGLTKDFYKYPWSSCLLYKKGVKKKTFIDYLFILNLLNEDIERAKDIYQDLLFQMNKSKIDNVLENPKSIDGLRKRVINFLKKIFDKKEKNLEALYQEEFLEEKLKELEGKRYLRNPQEIQGRKYLIQQLRARGYSFTEIAKKLKISRQSIYKTLKFTKKASLKV